SSLTPIELSDQQGAAEARRAPAEGLLRSTVRYMLRTEVHTFAFSVAANSILSFFPFLLLLITSTGIFLPLEVALNRVWGFRQNRSYLGNQLISLGLVFACGSLALLSVGLTAGNVALVKSALHGYGAWYVALVDFVTMKIFAILASIAIFFLVYWLLPNGKVPA